MNKKMCVNCKYLKDGKYCTRKKSDIVNPKIFCGYWRTKPTLFDLITADEETLAKKLVYQLSDGMWVAVLVYDGAKFTHRETAIAATVAKLKEIEYAE